MNEPKLTQFCGAATIGETTDWGRRMKIGAIFGLLVTVGSLGLSGCINVAAPEEPIVIELNVNIEATLLVELAEDANNTIDENADIF